MIILLDMNHELSEFHSNVRALITSSKRGLSTTEINRDYKDLIKDLKNIDTEAPTFGYENLEGLLKSHWFEKDLFISLDEDDGIWKWKIRPNDKDEHIHRLVQAPSKSDRNLKPSRVGDVRKHVSNTLRANILNLFQV